MEQNRTYELRRRLLVTILILILYLAGRSLLLYGIDPTAYPPERPGSQNILVSIISGDRHRYSVFALGIMPYITSNLIAWLYTAVRGSDFRMRISQQKIERSTLALAAAVAVVSAVLRADKLKFRVSALNVDALKAIAVLEMVAGAAVVYLLADLNRKRGAGGQTPIILVNIVDNLFWTAVGFSWPELRKPVALSLVMAAVILVMENVIFRIPVQRVSIHNEYADKSYIAFKLDPIGVMPVMFALSFFMIPQGIVGFLLMIFEDSQTLRLMDARLSLDDPVGACIYLGIIFGLNLIFSFIMVAPGEMSDQLRKSGDSIVGVYAGKKTKRYLQKRLLLLVLLSGCVLCLLMGMSLCLALQGEIPTELALLPATTMTLTGILCFLYREVKTYWRFDSYLFFM